MLQKHAGEGSSLRSWLRYIRTPERSDEDPRTAAAATLRGSASDLGATPFWFITKTIRARAFSNAGPVASSVQTQRSWAAKAFQPWARAVGTQAARTPTTSSPLGTWQRTLACFRAARLPATFNVAKQHESLRRLLLDTGDAYLAGSAHYDAKWGRGHVASEAGPGAVATDRGAGAPVRPPIQKRRRQQESERPCLQASPKDLKNILLPTTC